jgi:hypothetical protein
MTYFSVMNTSASNIRSVEFYEPADFQGQIGSELKFVKRAYTVLDRRKFPMTLERAESGAPTKQETVYVCVQMIEVFKRDTYADVIIYVSSSLDPDFDHTKARKIMAYYEHQVSGTTGHLKVNHDVIPEE